MAEQRVDSQERLAANLLASIREERIAIQGLHRAQQNTERIMAELVETAKNTYIQLDGMGLSQQEISMDLFRRNIVSLLTQQNILLAQQSISLGDVYTNLKAPGLREYDIVTVGKLLALALDVVVVVEVQNKLRRDDIRKFSSIQLPAFRDVFPRFRNYQVYGGMGALILNDNLQSEAQNQGLFVMTQGAEGAAQLLAPTEWKCY